MYGTNIEQNFSETSPKSCSNYSRFSLTVGALVSSDKTRPVLSLQCVLYLFLKLILQKFCKIKCTDVRVSHFTFIIFLFLSYCNKFFMHRDIPYIVSGTTPFLALLLVHFSQRLFERIFFFILAKVGQWKSYFFFIFKILKRDFR